MKIGIPAGGNKIEVIDIPHGLHVVIDHWGTTVRKYGPMEIGRIYPQTGGWGGCFIFEGGARQTIEKQFPTAQKALKYLLKEDPE